MSGKAMRGNSAHFLALRRRLDLLGYTDLPLGLDSAPLAQQMLEDYVSLAESFRESEENMNRLKEKLEITETQVEPLQSENQRLTRENVQLHQQLIMAQEDAMRYENQHSAAAFELQAENRRLKLLNQKSSQHVKELQKQLDITRERLQQSIAAPSMMKIPELIEADPRKMKKGSRSSSRMSSVVGSEIQITQPSLSFDPNFFNIELENLRKERDNAREDAENAIKQLNELKDSLKIRDQEIIRLGSNLQRETGKDGYLVSLRHKYAQQQEEIEKLRAQVRVVNPSATPTRRIKFILVPPRPTFHYDGTEAMSIIDTPRKSGIDKDYSDNQSGSYQDEEEEDVIQVQSPPKPEPIPTPIKQTTISEPAQIPQMQAVSQQQHSTIQQQQKKQQQLQSVIKKQDKEIQSLHKEVQTLQKEVDKLTDSIQDKDKAIAAMSVDFAFINDNIQSVMAEKDAIINELKNKTNNSTPEIIIDTEGVDKLQIQINEMEVEFKKELESKNQQIRQLEDMTQALSKRPEPKECAECNKLRLQLSQIQSQQHVVPQTPVVAEDHSEELEKLRVRTAQLETLIRAADTKKQDAEKLEQKLLQANNQLTERDAQFEKLRASAAAQQNELKEVQKSLEDANKKLKSQPDVEERYKSVIDKLKAEHAAMSKEIKQLTISNKALNEKLGEGQRIVRDLQTRLAKAQEEANTYQEDATFHREKSEEITKSITEKSNQVIKEANAAVQNYHRQLLEKTKECETFQALLQEARRQLAPLTETTIPQFKQQITRMQREHDDIVKKIRKVGNLFIYVKPGLADVANAGPFVTAFQKLSDEFMK